MCEKRQPFLEKSRGQIWKFPNKCHFSLFVWQSKYIITCSFEYFIAIFGVFTDLNLLHFLHFNTHSLLVNWCKRSVCLSCSTHWATNLPIYDRISQLSFWKNPRQWTYRLHLQLFYHKIIILWSVLYEIIPHKSRRDDLRLFGNFQKTFSP